MILAPYRRHPLKSANSCMIDNWRTLFPVHDSWLIVSSIEALVPGLIFWLVNHVRSHARTASTSASYVGKCCMKSFLDEAGLVKSMFVHSEYLISCCYFRNFGSKWKMHLLKNECMQKALCDQEFAPKADVVFRTHYQHFPYHNALKLWDPRSVLKQVRVQPPLYGKSEVYHRFYYPRCRG